MSLIEAAHVGTVGLAESINVNFNLKVKHALIGTSEKREVWP